MQSPSPPAANALPSPGSTVRLCLRSSSSFKGKPASSSDDPSKGAPARDITQIRRLRYLLDAREAKVHAVLDEALSWLIVPFAAEEEDAQHEPSPQALTTTTSAQPTPKTETETSLETASPAETSLAQSAAPSSAKGAASAGSSPRSLLPTSYADTPRYSPGEAPVPVSGLKNPPEAHEVPLSESTEGKPAAPGAEEAAEGGPAMKEAEGSSAPAQLPAEGAGGAASAAEAAAAGTDSEASDMEALPAVLDPVPFSAEELEKLDAEAAWDELEADEELMDCYYCPLLPQLLAASPLSGAGASATSPVPSSVGQGTAADVASPKRKRGRPKGSGKKTKSRLESSSSTAAPAAAAAVASAGLETGAGACASIPKPLDLADTPGAFDANSPGSSALASSPMSLWSGGSSDTFPPLADLLDFSQDAAALLGNPLGCPPLTSPATPSSSSVLQCSSSASSLAAASREDAAASPRVPVRSARLHASVQARRLMFACEDEGPEEPLFVPKESKRPQKGKTGRPRGRPRKVRPQEGPLGEAL